MPRAEKEFDIGFAISTPDEYLIEENAKEWADREGGSPELTEDEWNQLNEDMIAIERKMVNWLSKAFSGARAEGHSGEDLVGSMWVDPDDKSQLDILRSAEWNGDRGYLTAGSGSLTEFIDPCEGLSDKNAYLLFDVQVEFFEIPEELEELL